MSYKIVKEVDRLGRIVLPKSIRQHLKIKCGDSVFFELQNDKVMLGKYNEILGLIDFAELICESIYEMTFCGCIINDNEKIIAVSGVTKSLVGKPFVIENSEVVCDEKKIKIKDHFCQEIMSGQKCIGKIIVISNEDIDDKIKTTISIISRYLGKVAVG